MTAKLTADLEGRRWVRHFRGGTVAEIRFLDGQMLCGWTNRPHFKQKARIRRLIAEYVPWKRAILQEIVDETGEAILDISNTEPGVWEESVIAPRKEKYRNGSPSL